MKARKRGPVPKEPSLRIIEQLGTMPDQELAKQADVSLATVWRWRTARGIDATTNRWTPKAIRRAVLDLRKLKRKDPGITLWAAAAQLKIPVNQASSMSAAAKPPIVWPIPGRPRTPEAVERDRLVAELRGGDTPVPFSEIGDKIGISRQAAHAHAPTPA